MTKPKHIQTDDITAISSLVTDAILGITSIVEEIQHNIVEPKVLPKTPIQKAITGISKLSFWGVKTISKLVHNNISIALRALPSTFNRIESSQQREITLAIVNGVLGDHLQKANNSLEIKMSIRHKGKQVELHEANLTNTYGSSKKILLVLHGLCMNDLQWTRKGINHAENIANTHNYVPVYVHYNTGLHISDNGNRLAEILQHLFLAWPTAIDQISVLAHSMGGLVFRSTIQIAEENKLSWRDAIDKIAFLGTPHHGAPLERAGNYVDITLDNSPFIKPLSKIGKIRSAGITDLRYGSISREDWFDKNRFANSSSPRKHVPLPKDVDILAVAASKSPSAGGTKERILGDGLVYVDSALGKHKKSSYDLQIPSENTFIEQNISHFDLLSDVNVGQRLNSFFNHPDS